MNVVALIPARSGSIRVPGKNLRVLDGHPLLAYSVRAAIDAGLPAFVSSDDDGETRRVAEHYGATFIHCSKSIAHDSEAVPRTDIDILWVRHALLGLDIFPELVVDETAKTVTTQKFDVFTILRPTSPFRTWVTVKRALNEFGTDCDSMRAVEPVKQHPMKMWIMGGDQMTPLSDKFVKPRPPAFEVVGFESWKEPSPVAPTHSMPSQMLPKVYVQNSSLEIAWTRVVREQGTISGTNIAPFFTAGAEGFAIDTEADWREAEYLASRGHLMAIQYGYPVRRAK